MDDRHCTPCGTTFATPTALLYHVQSTGHLLTCPFCHQIFSTVFPTFSDVSTLRTHCQIEHDDPGFFCRHCTACDGSGGPLLFRNGHELRLHNVLLHWGCGLCMRVTSFKGVEELRKHERDEHYVCGICAAHGAEAIFAEEWEHGFHVMAKHKACPLCGIVNRDTQGLREHILNCHFWCEMCVWRGLKRPFPTQMALDTHVENEHWRCGSEGCAEPFNMRREVEAHQRMRHGFTVCPFCEHPPRISWGQGARGHMERCSHPNPYNDFDAEANLRIEFCHLCDRHFLCPAEALAHFRKCHPCAECEGYIARYYECRNEHILEHHRRGEALRMREGYQFQSDYPPSTFASPARPDTRWYTSARGQGGEWNTAFESFLRNNGYQFSRKRDQRQQKSSQRSSRKRPRARTSKRPPPQPPKTPKIPQEEAPLDVYAVLRIDPQSSYEEARQAARKRRIETHPDRLMREGLSKDQIVMIDEGAKLVGFAADIVLNVEKREEHDRKMDAYNRKYA